MLGELTGLSSTLRAALLGVAVTLLLALAGAGWALKHQTERLGGLETENATLAEGLTAASDAYAALGAWAQAKDRATANAQARARTAETKLQSIMKDADHVPESHGACPALDAVLDGLRREYPDDPGADEAGTGTAAPGADPAHAGAVPAPALGR